MKNTEGQKPEDLRTRTKSLALRVIKMYGKLPKSTEAQVIGRQVLRSGTAVGANYREAYRARSDAEFISKMGDCLKELDETAYWFELLVEGGIVKAGQLAPLQDEVNQLIAIFVTIIKKRKRNLKD
ncbi:MAG: four helix bundle protein [Chloroflexi bacterium]|nr:four helix bundle protein [Chloroflexota bacterium]